MIEKIQINGFEDKTAKNGKPYMRFNTSKGWFSCFDSLVGDKLKELKEAVVEITERDGFKNIKRLCADNEYVDQNRVEIVKIPSATSEKNTEVRKVQALTSAIKTLSSSKAMFNAEQAIRIAEDYYAWIVK